MKKSQMFELWNRFLKYLSREFIHQPTVLLHSLKRQNNKVLNNTDSYEIENLDFNILLRKNGSDIEVYNQIMVDKEYQIILDYFNINSIRPKLIIDCGANIGLTSLVFAIQYKEANIISVEPDQGNFLQLVNNTKKFKNIFPFQNAIWSSNIKLNIDRNYRDGKDWSIRTVKHKTNSDQIIESITISQLIDSSGFKEVDLLKIDVEGAEKNLFKDKNTCDFLAKTKCIAVEIHDEIADRLHIYSMLKQFGFILINSGELTIGIKP